MNAYPALPDPFDVAVAALDPVFDEKAPVFQQRRGNFFAHACAVFRMLQLLVRKVAVVQKLLRAVAGQVVATVADELHRPVLVVAAAINHAVEVAHQRRQHALLLAQCLT